jgi:hypothetical protein
VSLAFVVVYGSAGAGARWMLWSEDVGLEAVLPRLRRWDAVDLDLKQHGDVLRSTCHNDMCLAACGGPVHRLTKPFWPWCFFRSGDGGDSASLSTCVYIALEFSGGR